MDELIKEALAFKDLTDTFSLWEALISMSLSFVLALAVGWIYRITHESPSYSKSFVQTLVIMGVVVSVIMLVIGSNIARAFSLVGALSIIRFRTAIKDSRDVAFVFLVMAIGMSCGTRFYKLAILFTAFSFGMIYTLHRLRVGEKVFRDKLLRVSLDPQIDFNVVFKPLFDKYLSSFKILESVTSPDGARQSVSWNVQFHKANSELDFVRELRALSKDDHVQLLSGDDYVTI